MELKAAKVSEAKSWVKNIVISAMLGNEDVNRDELMRMRWVVTWKEDETAPEGAEAESQARRGRLPRPCPRGG